MQKRPPEHGAGLGRATRAQASGLKCKYQVVVQVEWLATASGDGVDIAADQSGRSHLEIRSRLFEHFATSGIRRRVVFGFDVTAGQKPSPQPAVVD